MRIQNPNSERSKNIQEHHYNDVQPGRLIYLAPVRLSPFLVLFLEHSNHKNRNAMALKVCMTTQKTSERDSKCYVTKSITSCYRPILPGLLSSYFIPNFSNSSLQLVSYPTNPLTLGLDLSTHHEPILASIICRQNLDLNMRCCHLE